MDREANPVAPGGQRVQFSEPFLAPPRPRYPARSPARASRSGSEKTGWIMASAADGAAVVIGHLPARAGTGKAGPVPVPAVSWSAPPHPTSHPGWLTSARASATRDDLPIPGSPSTQTTVPLPRPSASPAARRTPSSRSRPTQWAGRIGHMQGIMPLPRRRCRRRRPGTGCRAWCGPSGTSCCRTTRMRSSGRTRMRSTGRWPADPRTAGQPVARMAARTTFVTSPGSETIARCGAPGAMVM